MDDPTILVGPGSDARFASAGDPEPGLAVIWGRDGLGPPAAGAPGELIDLGIDAFSRYVLARAPDGRVVVVEVQRDVVDPADFPVTWGPVTNKIIEAIWRRMSLNASAASDLTGATVSLGFEAHRPVLVCRERGVAFRPPSPVSGRIDALRDCRDEETLANAGLPAWSGTTKRFLVDSYAVRTTSRPQFYTADEELPRGASASVGAWDKFIRDLGYMAVPDAAREAAARALGARFPCVACQEAPRCFPRTGVGVRGEPGRGARRLTPLALHPFRAVAHPRERAHFHEHCDILGGAPWAAFRGRHAKTWTTPGVRSQREALEESAAFRRTRAPTPLSALRVKLGLLEELVDAVAEYHRAHGQPHLGLSPQTVVSISEAAGEDGRYGVALRGAVRGVMLRDLMPAPPGMPMWLPPPHAVEPYAHADIVRASEPIGRAAPDGTDVHRGGFRHARSTPIRITVGRLWEDVDRGTAEAEIDVVGLPLGDMDVHATDRIRLRLQGAGWDGVTLWCRPDEERVGQGAFATRLFRARLTTAQILDLRSASTGSALFGHGAVFRTYGAWYDIHALGMLIARALLDNSRNPLDRIVADALPNLVSLASSLRETDADAARQQLANVISDVAGSAPLDAFVGPEVVCFLPGETAAQGGRVPPGVWSEALATIVACVTVGPPASICSSTRLEMERDAFSAPIEALLKRIRDLRQRLPAAQPEFGSDPMGETSDAVFDDPRDVRIQQLERELTSAMARIERLQSEVASLDRSRDVEDVPVLAPVAAEADAASEVAEQAWRVVYEAVVGGSIGELPPFAAGEPAFELVKSLASDGLTTMSSVLTGLAELGGQDFALEHRNLRRVVRQALLAAADGNPAKEQRLAEAARALRDVPRTVGTAIGMLVEAHGKSSMDGSRQMLLTLSYAMRKELDLSRTQQRKLADIMTRMNDGLGDLIARLYDPIFQAHVQQRLGSTVRGSAGGGSAGREGR